MDRQKIVAYAESLGAGAGVSVGPIGIILLILLVLWLLGYVHV